MISPPPGVYENIPFAEYLLWEAMNKSSLWAMRKSPAHFRWERDHPRKSTGPMDKGTLLDTLLFEGEAALDKKAMLRPGGHGNAKIVREAHTEAEITGRILVTEADLAILKLRVQNIKEHPKAAELLEACEKQLSIVWIDPHTSVLCKSRIDLTETNGPRVADLKHTRNAEVTYFRRDIPRFGYQIQAALNIDGLRIATKLKYNEFLFIAAEDEPPYCCNVIPLGAASIAAGRAAYSRWLYQYKRCLEADEWPGYDDSHTPVDIPIYALAEEGIQAAPDYEWGG